MTSIAMAVAVSKSGYQGFGSFHSGNVELLIHQSEAEYTAPANPFRPQLLNELHQLPLGSEFKVQFMIDFASWTFVNHGAFGGVLRCAYDEADLWRRHCEQQPLRFLDRELFPHVVRVTREMAKFINCQPQDLAFVPNATTGLNTVIQSLTLAPGDTLYMLDVGYGSVKKMLEDACQRTGASLVYGALQLPIRCAQDVTDLVSRTLPPNCKLAVFDAVTSNTALLLPIQQLCKLCRARGVPVLIDGAHALGQLHVDLTDLDADYFVSNCHKWLSGPRGSAILWVHPKRKKGLRPLVVSHGAGSGFTSEFIWDGCRDYAPLLGVSAALRFWTGVGLERAQCYMRQLLQQAVALLTAAWGTETLAPLELCGSMALVRLPPMALCAARQPDSGDAKYIQDVLHFQYAIECPVKLLEAMLYVRISAAVYNTLEDYQKLAAAIIQLAAAPAPAPAVGP